ncbi:ParB/RepB/Spo0J family partition protein [Pseudomarimonas salicorniae]|uniref:Probable chromosome-partitioning protein ParB n=1 Tax=Pseudomarimonas salicorniae TaxID=2933270 RepID=A0ABT0GHV5_9GAMM|nr:ParB/RepB/Spo0J family partition protein [Lysobacter sp. CAU 1642]MCK7593595.1 ParB/RepB/Spo0J family partition protein [Lysobacter sp. CAU 1642]
MSAKKRGLGRGLSELLGSGTQESETPLPGDRQRNLPIEQLQPGKYQPRTQMDPARLQELADSIRAQGLIQPIVVRAVGRDRYEIIAGERRWRAAQLAELRDVPVIQRDIDDHTALAMALIENIQREDLNPLEEAVALQRLIDEFSLTHQQAAEAVGRSRAAVSNLLRLLELPDGVRRLVEQGRIEMGHARALLTLPEALAEALARQAAEEGWSVREIERRVQQAQRAPGKPAPKPAANPDVATLERELSEHLGASVSVQGGRGKGGKLVIRYHDLDQLDGLLERLRR